MRAIATLLLSIILFGCTKPNQSEPTPFELINKHRSDLNYTESQVTELMQSKKFGGSPCVSDYNEDGVINTGDLIILLPLIGTKGVTTAQLNELLANFGQNYIIEVIPAYNNFINDVSGCGLTWEAYTPSTNRWLIRKRCNGTFSWYANFDSLQWIYECQVVSRHEDNLRFQVYNLDGTPRTDCVGWQPPCNGINLVGMRVFDNGHSFYRENYGWATINNAPDSIPFCGNVAQSEFLFGNSFLPYEFLEN
jgi:hypothetical protein